MSASAAAWHPPHPHSHRGARSSREDIPMLDYSSGSSRAISGNSSNSVPMSGISGMSFEHSKQPSMTAPMDEESYNLLIGSLAPSENTVRKGVVREVEGDTPKKNTNTAKG